MDDATRKVVEAHDSELSAVRSAIQELHSSLNEVSASLKILHTVTLRIERRIASLPCGAGVCDPDKTPAEVPRAKRRLRAIGQGKGNE